MAAGTPSFIKMIFLVCMAVLLGVIGGKAEHSSKEPAFFTGGSNGLTLIFRKISR